MKIDIDIEELRKQLNSLQPKVKKSATAIIASLSGEINKLQKCGYTFNEIADIMKQRGVKASGALISRTVAKSRSKKGG